MLPSTRSVIGAEFAHTYDSLERRRCELERGRCQHATPERRERIASVIIASSRRPRLRAGSAAWALQQQQRKRQSDEDKDKSKKAKAAAAEQGGSVLFASSPALPPWHRRPVNNSGRKSSAEK
eukprot:5953711-Prymnesium_polylepis.1